MAQRAHNTLDGYPEVKEELHRLFPYRVSDWYLDTTNNRTLIRGERSHAKNRLYYGNEVCAYWI